VLDALRKAHDLVAAQLKEADPDAYRAVDAVAIVAQLAELERLAAGGRLLFATRAAQSRRWREEGHSSPAHWMAATTGTGLAEAAAGLETSAALRHLPGTEEALRRGALSPAQVQLVTRAASSAPGAEGGLLAAAATGALSDLRRQAAAVVARAGTAEGEARRARALHHQRFLRTWSGPEGALQLRGQLTPEAGATLLGALAPLERARFAEARRSGERLGAGQGLADALLALATGAGEKKTRTGSKTTPSTAVVRVDAEALRRGHAEAGETCEIAGVGPVPVARVRALLPEAFVKIVFHEACDVTSVVHVGRAVPAPVQSALEERDRACVVPGCGRTLGLENHHYQEDYATSRVTSLDALARVCSFHHDRITYDGFHLTGGPGRWELRAPEVAVLDTG